MAHIREGTPYQELMVSPIFGLLAHAHSWRSGKTSASATDVIAEHLNAADAKHVKHPREIIDLVCVSNLATWATSKQPLSDPKEEIDETARATMDPKGVLSTSFMCHAGRRGFFANQEFEHFSPIGVFISELLVKLAWEDPPLREIASYFLAVEFSRTSFGTIRQWDRTIYSESLRRKLSLSKLKNEIDWNEWASSIE